MKKALLMACLLFATACSAQSVAPAATVDLSKVHNDTLVTCKYKLDGSELDYLQSQRTDVKSSLFTDYTISNIVDLGGKHWSVNPAEWSNFVCTSKVLP